MRDQMGRRLLELCVFGRTGWQGLVPYEVQLGLHLPGLRGDGDHLPVPHRHEAVQRVDLGVHSLNEGTNRCRRNALRLRRAAWPGRVSGVSLPATDDKQEKCDQTECEEWFQ